MAAKIYNIDVRWDAESKVWYCQSDEVPGLVAECDNLDQLIGEVSDLAPELLSLNKALPDVADAALRFRVEREETVKLAG